jgi:RNA polymerase sigma-70 factor (sigma-E family)
VRTEDQDFTDFMHASADRLFRVAYLLTGDRHRAEDLAQDALARTFSAWRRVRQENAFGYARRVMVNLHTDWWRAHRWRERSVGELPVRAGAPDPAVAVVRRDSVVRALRTLTRRERTIVVLRYFADMPEAAVANELNISVGTVKSTAARALGKLRGTADLAEPTTVEGTR